MAEWFGVTIPTSLAPRVDRVIEEGTYRSRGEVVKTALIEWLARHEREAFEREARKLTEAVSD